MTLGLIGAAVVLIFTILGGTATFGVGLWTAGRWTGELQTKLDTIILDIKIVKAENNDLRQKVEGHETRIIRIETAGSPSLQNLLNQLNSLQKQIDLHEAEARARASKGTP